MDLEEAADLLYALPSSQFTARRGELAGQARTAGETAVGKQIAQLRRPTVSAGLVNRLIRAAQDDDAGETAALAERIHTLGDELRQAQTALDGAAMKELTPQRHELVAALVRRAGELVDDGQKVSGSVQRELEETFAAAIADEQAALAVTSGRLTRALVYSGFGEVDVTAATATPLNRGSGARSGTHGADSDRHLSPVGDPPSATGEKSGSGAKGASGSRSAIGSKAAAISAEEAEAQAAAEAEAELQRLRATAKSAKALLQECEEQLTVSTTRQQEVHAQEADLATRLDELQREVLRTRHELDSVSRQVSAADRDQQRQERQTRDARKAVDRAQQAVDRLTKAD